MRNLAIILSACCLLACTKKEKVEFLRSTPPEALHESGLIQSEGMALVIAHCTSCHSAKTITQNRATREGWESTIRWMQATQNLWPLGENESIILDYLAKNYAPQKVGRRKNLDGIEWYPLTTD